MSKSIGQSFKRFFSMPKIVRRFNNDEKGVTAVEFAFVAGPFFLIISSIIEVSIFLFASQYLETSIDNVARDIRTGNLQSAVQTAVDTELAAQASKPPSEQKTEEELVKEAFKDQFCAEIVALFECDGILVQVTTANNFSSLNPLPQPSNGSFDPNDFSQQDVQSGQIFKVHAIYEWPVYTNYVGRSFISPGNNSIYINVTAVVRAEQF
ncbi:MAG: TadE/TadG family type IV pilus assembly protein [Chloroflexota bacterium]